MKRVYVSAEAYWDTYASVFVAESDDVPGLVTEAPSLEALRAKLPGIIQDLLDIDDAAAVDIEVRIRNSTTLPRGMS